MTPPLPRRRHPRCALPSAILFALLVLAPVRADGPRGFFRLQLENDLGWTDRYYTHGTRIDRMYPALSAPRWVRSVLDCLEMPPGDKDLAGWYLGQLMFTPSRLDLPVPNPNDRPFGGWLFLGVQRHSFGEASWGGRKLPYRDIRAFSVGVTGRWSGAEAAQKGVHWIGRKFTDNGFIPPQGWDYQIPTEPTFDAFLERKWKLAPMEGPLTGDLLPYINANIGTVNDVVRAGATLRAGWNIPDDDFAHSTIQLVPLTAASADQTASATARGSRKHRSGPGAHVFATAEGKYVARNAFYDGALFRNSRSVPKENWVYDFVVGFTLSTARTQFTYCRVIRSKEFKAQATRQEFHSLAFTRIY